MITYVDTSTLLKLIIDEPGSDKAEATWTAADAVASVTLIEVEGRAALAAAHRQQRLTKRQHTTAVATLDELIAELHLIEVTNELIKQATRLTEAEGLRGYDAVHLAAALTVPTTIFTSADTALCNAALHQGLHTANPLAP